jgi:hypothetical protein
MNDTGPQVLGFSKRSFVYCALAIAHALLVFVIWYVAFALDRPVINARYWLAFAWLWLAWLFVLTPRIAREKKLVLPTIGLSIALLVPCASTIYSFTAWLVQDFAP